MSSAELSLPRTGGAERELWRLMEEVARAGSAEQLYQSALSCLSDILGVERAAVLLFDDSGTMRFVAWKGLSDEYRRAVDVHSPWRPDERAAAPVLVPDVRRDPSLAAYGEVFAREGIAAFAFVPLAFADRLLGKFMLYHDEPHEFTEREIAITRIVAGHIAYALEHRRVEQDLERRLRAEQRALYRAEDEIARRRAVELRKDLLVQAGQALSRSLDLEETLEALGDIAVPAFADWYILHLLDERGEIVPAHIAHVDPLRVEQAWEVVRRWPTRAGETTGVAGVIASGRPLLVEQVTSEIVARVARDAEHLEQLEEVGLHSALIVPLSVRQRTIGAMTLMAAESKRNYDRDDLELVETLAGRAALGIDNARLYGAAEGARRRAVDAAWRLDVLAQASAAVADSLDPDTALQQLARFLVSTLANYCVTYRLDNDGSIRRVGLAHSDPGQQATVEQLVLAGPPRLDDPYGVGAVLRTGEALLAADISAELLETSAQNAKHLEVLRRLAPRSSLVAPLQARGRTVGALALATTDLSERRYDEADLALVQELAGRAALLIDNARLYREARAATRARDEMLAVVSHDLRSPLGTIVTASELLGMNLPEERRARTRDSLRSAAREMNRLLDDLLDVTRLEHGDLVLQVEPVDVAALVAEVISLHEPVAEERSMRLTHQVEAGVGRIEGDHDRLRQALSNLLGNALKFTPQGGAVSLSARAEDDVVRLEVADTGPGIPHEERPLLFDRFWRGDRDSGGGVGLGLAIAKGIAEIHRGTIEVESSVGEGSLFTLVLPRSLGGPDCGSPSDPGASRGVGREGAQGGLVEEPHLRG